MIKKLLYTFLFLISSLILAQVPNGYYSTATGSGYTLKTQLKNIITNGHVNKGYGALYDAYVKTDNDSYYEKDNTVLDMYSENPSNNDPYNYNHNTRKCGNYNSENDCYNREHIFPQGFFNKLSPMRTDIHHVVPSDGYVNGKRSNYPFGEVSSPSWTSDNESKLGPNTFSGYSGIVFEPIDEFKGDIARMLLYFAVRYEDDVTSSSWDPHTATNNPLNGTNDQVYETWYLKLLHKWHTDDPVSQREIVRNNEAYSFQGNRNPFIDNPNYVNDIWGTVLSINEENAILSSINIFPNPSTVKKVNIRIPNASINITNISLYSVIGRKVFSIKKPVFNNNLFTIESLNSGIYLLKISSENSSTTKKIIVQ